MSQRQPGVWCLVWSRKWFALTGMRQHVAGKEGASSLLQGPESRPELHPSIITWSYDRAVTWHFPLVLPPRQLPPSGSVLTCRWRPLSVLQSCLWSDSRRSGPSQSSQTPETRNRFRFHTRHWKPTPIKANDQGCFWAAPCGVYTELQTVSVQVQRVSHHPAASTKTSSPIGWTWSLPGLVWSGWRSSLRS